MASDGSGSSKTSASRKLSVVGGLLGIQQSGRRSMPGDVIIAADGQAVGSYDDLYTALDERSPGDVVRFTLTRNGTEREVEVTLYELP